MTRAAVLLVLTLVTDAVLILIATETLRLVKRIRTRFARLQAMVVVLLCATGVVASIEDLGFHALRLGWLMG